MVISKTEQNEAGMNEPSFQVYGLGQCSLDHIGKVNRYPEPDTKCEFFGSVMQGGGPVATALVALSRWGISCTFAGVVGDDLFGPMIKASLADEGVDTSGLLVRNRSDSQVAFIVAEPGSGRRTIFWRKPTGSPLNPGEIDYGLLRKARVLHTDGLFAEVSIAACQAAREAGVQVVVDAGSMREGMLDLASIADCFLASETFARALVGADEPLEACYLLADLGPSVVGVTLGSRGYVVLFKDRIIREPAYRVEAVDTTGCGDVFHGGFIYGLIRGWDVEKSLDFASWAAAMVSLELGGRAGIPSPEDWKST